MERGDCVRGLGRRAPVSSVVGGYQAGAKSQKKRDVYQTKKKGQNARGFRVRTDNGLEDSKRGPAIIHKGEKRDADPNALKDQLTKKRN